MEKDLIDDACYSEDDRVFAKRDHLLRILDDEGGLYVGRQIFAKANVSWEPASYLSMTNVLRIADSKAGTDLIMSGYRDDFCNASQEAKIELHQFLKTWVEKHIKGEYRLIGRGDSYKVVLTEEMIRAYYSRAGLKKEPAKNPVPIKDHDETHGLSLDQ